MESIVGVKFNQREITAVILAGGLGTRLKSVVADRPKVMADVACRPFLAYLLDQIGATGISRVVICTGYKAEIVAEQFGASYRGLNLIYSQEQAPLGTGGALRLAGTHLRGPDPVLVLNGDSYCDFDLPAFLDWHCSTSAKASLILTEMPDTGRYGRVEVDDTGNVLGFSEKLAGSGKGWINAGIYLLSRDFLQSLPPSAPLSIERDVFPRWVGRGLRGFRCRARFIDIGTPESYSMAEQFFTPVTAL
jgi:NDP-sugar pyrophosphorylase family protein